MGFENDNAKTHGQIRGEPSLTGFGFESVFQNLA
jgi:hypothetical protein